MKRYLLFVWDQYYPLGGMNDFKGSFDTLEEAEEKGKEKVGDDTLARYDVVDTHTIP